jgi:hypothetical protein
MYQDTREIVRRELPEVHMQLVMMQITKFVKRSWLFMAVKV